MLMAKFFCGLVAVLMLFTNIAQASDFKVNVHLVCQDDGTAFGELYYNEQVVWRLKICSDGVEAVTGWNSTGMTVVVPDVVNGMFLLKVYNQ
jgi:hypothetical protein